MEFVNSIAQIVHHEVGRRGWRHTSFRVFLALRAEPAALPVLHHTWPPSAMHPPHALPHRRLHTCPVLPSTHLPSPPQVSLHGGAANKNIGDAFLLVWKLPGSRREAGRSSLSRTRSQGSGISRMSRASSCEAARPGVVWRRHVWKGCLCVCVAALCEEGCSCGSHPPFTPPSHHRPHPYTAYTPHTPTFQPAARISMLMGCDREPERKEEAANIADQALASFIIIQASGGTAVPPVVPSGWRAR